MANIFEDLKKIESLKSPNFLELVRIIEDSLKIKFSSEFNDTPFDKLMRENRVDIAAISSTVDLLTNVMDIIVRYDKNVKDGLEKIEKNIKNGLDKDTEAMKTWGKIKDAISKMEYLNLTRKKVWLQESFSKIDTFSFVCDARPLFNLERTEIAQFIFPVLLNITDKKGLKFNFELEEDDIKRIKSEIECVMKKLELLKRKCL